MKRSMGASFQAEKLPCLTSLPVWNFAEAPSDDDYYLGPIRAAKSASPSLPHDGPEAMGSCAGMGGWKWQQGD